jgi:hypothetical protein
MSEKEKAGFDALLDEIGGLAKALPAEGDAAADDKVAAAAEEGAEGGEGEGDEEEAEMGKSFKLKLEDGTEVDAMDGTELVKSLIGRVEGNEEKVLAAVTGLVGIVKSQGELVKSLQGQVATLSASGKGRKAVLTITEKPAPKAEELKKSEGGEGMTGEEFMAKAMAAQVAGKITARHIAIADQYVGSGQQPPADIVRAVLG